MSSPPVANQSQVVSDAWPEQRVERWEQLPPLIDSLGGCLFRGQGKQQWKLVPLFNRWLEGADQATALRLERDNIVRFRSEAHLFLAPSVLPPNPLKLDALDSYVEWLMVMQHYGAPTRLLDWSLSPYVSTYFAAIDDWDSDGAVWYFNPTAATAPLYRRHGRELGSYFDYADLPATEITQPTGEPLLYVAAKKMRTEREIAQQGYFTFVSTPLSDQQEIIRRTSQGVAHGRIVIAKECKPQIVMQLRTMNVTAASLFPGVMGICNSIKSEMQLQQAIRLWQQAAKQDQSAGNP